MRRILSLLLAWALILSAPLSFGQVTTDATKTGITAGAVVAQCFGTTTVNGAADTNENTLATCTLPAGAMGLNGTLRVWTLWTMTNSVNNKILRVKLGATSFTSLTYTTVATVSHLTMITNRSSASSQVGFNSGAAVGLATSTSGNTTGSIDTSGTVSLTITCQKALGSETCSLDRYLVELIPG